MVEDWTGGMLLLACRRMNRERSLQAVVHLLKGRKSNQVLQDASLFGTSLLYGELYKLSKEKIENQLHKLESQGYIEILSQRSVGCTDQGEKTSDHWVDDMDLHSCFSAIRSVGKKEETFQFWMRLELMVQTLSYTAQGDLSFYPVVEKWGIREDVKGIFYQGGDSRNQAIQLKNELASWLRGLQDWEQKILLLRWSGKGKAGLTFPQIGEVLQKPAGWVRFQLYRLVAEKSLHLHPMNNPILLRLAFSQKEPQGLSQSTRITRRFLEEGKNLQDIASKRGLRMGTIEDHIVEIALADPAFSISPFVKDEKVKRINDLIETSGARKLGELKRLAGQDFSFLEIRLVCARGTVNLQG